MGVMARAPGTKNTKLPLAASAMAILFASTLFAPARADAQTYEPYRGGVWVDNYSGLAPAYPYRGYGPAGFQPPPRFAPRIPPGYDPERPARSGWRRGEHLPPDFRGEVVTDFAHYHLRHPPRGYFWYRDADDYVLAAASTGLIFEVIPGD
jgi:Ni/Co efflux regulator RcnB